MCYVFSSRFVFSHLRSNIEWHNEYFFVLQTPGNRRNRRLFVIIQLVVAAGACSPTSVRVDTCVVRRFRQNSLSDRGLFIRDAHLPWKHSRDLRTKRKHGAFFETLERVKPSYTRQCARTIIIIQPDRRVKTKLPGAGVVILYLSTTAVPVNSGPLVLRPPSPLPYRWTDISGEIKIRSQRPRTGT